MYVSTEKWSVPDPGDPPPCFRQGDLVRLTWARPEVTVSPTENGNLFRINNLEVRTEVVALLSACCDLVVRASPKRKGVVISPLRPIPKNIASNRDLLALLKMQSDKAYAAAQRVPVNLFCYNAVGDDVKEGVIYLEAVAMVDYSTLRGATKLAEIDDAWRNELKERIKRNFTRIEPA